MKRLALVAALLFPIGAVAQNISYGPSMAPNASNATMPDAITNLITNSIVESPSTLVGVTLPSAGGGTMPSSSERYLHLSVTGTNADSAPQAASTFNLPLNYHSVLFDKYVAGSTVSTISHGNFNTARFQHSNNMRRAAVGDWWHSNGSGLRSTTYIGNDGTGGARGSSNGVTARAYLYDQADYAAGKTGTEAQSLSGYTHALKDRNNAYAMIWGVDSTVIGPTIGQEGGIFGMPIVVAKRNAANTISISADGNSDKRGAYGLTVQSIPGIASQPPSGDDNAGTATYPLDAAIAITGYTGDYDGANIANDGSDATARALADYAVKIGGLSMGPWYETRATRQRSNSKINNGIDISQHYGIGLHIHSRHGLNTGTAIKVTSTGGTVELATATGIGVAPSSSYQLDVLSDVRVQGPTTAHLYLSTTSSAANEKLWDFAIDGSTKSFLVQTRADDKTFGANAWIATRSGTAITTQEWLVGGAVKLKLASGLVTVSEHAAINGSVMLGSATPLTMATGEMGFQKIAASGTAPGAAGGKIGLVCGTNAGTAKLIAYAGTSTTSTTILDNIGSGVTGC